MRTWRQRAKEMVKWHDNGGLQMKLDALEVAQSFIHDGNFRRASMVREVIADPLIIQTLHEDLKRTHIFFARIEYLRISLAKHEVPGKAKSLAISPGTGASNNAAARSTTSWVTAST